MLQDNAIDGTRTTWQLAHMLGYQAGMECWTGHLHILLELLAL